MENSVGTNLVNLLFPELQQANTTELPRHGINTSILVAFILRHFSSHFSRLILLTEEKKEEDGRH